MLNCMYFKNFAHINYVFCSQELNLEWAFIYEIQQSWNCLFIILLTEVLGIILGGKKQQQNQTTQTQQ